MRRPQGFVEWATFASPVVALTAFALAQVSRELGWTLGVYAGWAVLGLIAVWFAVVLFWLRRRKSSARRPD